jgi:hypothetical protein
MPKRFLIDAVVLRAPENTVAPGFSWRARRINILVMPHISRYSNGGLTWSQDFLAVRKIPVKSHERLGEHDLATSSNSGPEAQTVSTYLATIRKYLMRDRTLHDMVLFFFSFPAYFV